MAKWIALAVKIVGILFGGVVAVYCAFLGVEVSVAPDDARARLVDAKRFGGAVITYLPWLGVLVGCSIVFLCVGFIAWRRGTEKAATEAAAKERATWTPTNTITVFIRTLVGTRLVMHGADAGTLHQVGLVVVNMAPFPVRLMRVDADWYANMIGGSMSGKCKKQFGKPDEGMVLPPHSPFVVDGGADAMDSEGKSAFSVTKRDEETVTFQHGKVVVRSDCWTECEVAFPDVTNVVRVKDG